MKNFSELQRWRQEVEESVNGVYYCKLPHHHFACENFVLCIYSPNNTVKEAKGNTQMAAEGGNYRVQL